MSWAQANTYLPTGIQLGIDLIGPLYGKYQKTGPQYAFNGLLDFNRLLVQGDYGWGFIERQGFCKKQGIGSSSKNQGQYFRIGLDLNLLKNSIDHNAAFLGLRYAKSYFQDQLHSALLAPYWGTYHINSKQANMQARWLELVAGVRVKAWQWIYLGCTAHYKFKKKLAHNNAHIPFDVLGWGLNQEDALELNCYLIVRIPLQRSAAPDYSKQPESQNL